jgi:hypothetical protein
MLIVAYFEVYLEDAAQEVVHHVGFRILPDRNMDGPSWKSLKTFYSRIGYRLDTEKVRRIRNSRHWLVHRRASVSFRDLDKSGDLKSLSLYDDWERYGPDRKVTPEQVHTDAAILSSVVRDIDPTMWRAAWRDDPSPELRSMVAEVESQGNSD